MQAMRFIGFSVAIMLTLAFAAMSAGCGGSGGGLGQSGVPKGHGVNKTVSYTDRYGKTTVGIESAGTTAAIFEGLDGTPDTSRKGEFVFVTLNKFESPILTPGDLLEVKGSDGLLYSSSSSNGPDSGMALWDSSAIDPNHFTEAFDLPKNAAKGAVLIVHENGTERDALDESSLVGRRPPYGYDEGAHEVDLGL